MKLVFVGKTESFELAEYEGSGSDIKACFNACKASSWASSYRIEFLSGLRNHQRIVTNKETKIIGET
jgi:hypothetical protein